MKKEDIKAIVPVESIEGSIHIIRGQKVILDQDLAALYKVDTGSFNRAISRNQKRFPEDFAFCLTKNEWEILKCQIGISRFGWGGRRTLPMAFTEHGVVMAANLLRSKRAIDVSVEIVRAFIRLRQIVTIHKETAKEVSELKDFVLRHSNANDREFKRVWNAIEKLAKPIDGKNDGKIGFRLG